VAEKKKNAQVAGKAATDSAAKGKAEKSAKKPADSAPHEVRLKKRYQSEIVPALAKQFEYKNVNQVPRLEKVVLNMGVGDIKDNSKSLQLVAEELRQIAGQKPLSMAARKSVANFKLREGMKVGLKVTLRGDRMYEFVDKLVSVVLPRVRDFRGISANSFDGRGNYSMGLKEQLIFPEISYDQIEKIRGLDICFVTTARTDEEARGLLKALGMPFRAN